MLVLENEEHYTFILLDWKMVNNQKYPKIFFSRM